jgi:hypothetical protein
VLLPPAPTPAAALAPAQPAPAHGPAQSAPAKKGLLSSLKQGALQVFRLGKNHSSFQLQAALAEAVTATEERFEHLEGAGNSGIHADVFLSYAIY